MIDGPQVTGPAIVMYAGVCVRWSIQSLNGRYVRGISRRFLVVFDAHSLSPCTAWACEATRPVGESQDWTAPSHASHFEVLKTHDNRTLCLLLLSKCGDASEGQQTSCSLCAPRVDEANGWSLAWQAQDDLMKLRRGWWMGIGGS